jgi:GNAT superfamily N-acetyltransferase
MNEVTVERLTTYDEGDSTELGRLMTYLSDKCSGAPIPREVIEAVITSEHHDQIVARCHDRIVGAATVSLVMNIARGNMGYLEAFVVDPSMRGRGVADAIWTELMSWCRERGVRLEFTSNDARLAAHKFYHAHGATIRKTTVFTTVPDAV